MSKFKFKERARKARFIKLKKLNDEIGAIAVEYSRDTAFPSERWDGVRWKKPLRKLGRPLLQKTGKLRASIRVLRSSSRSVQWGSRVRYAAYHNEGTGKLPMRKFVGVDKKLGRLIDKTVKKNLSTIFDL